MKKLTFLLISLFVFYFYGFSQLSGIKNIPGDYATIALAITDLNAVGVAAPGVTFNVVAGYTETFSSPVAGLITATGTTPNDQIIFQKSGIGANPVITAGTGTSTTVDGIIVIRGGNYITFDGIDLQENVANVTATTQMEWGYALVRTSVIDGAQNNTIKNCVITLNKANANSSGIYSGNHTNANTTALSITNVSGANSNNKINGNTVSNAFHPIYFNGFNDATPYTYYDQNNEIGFTTANIISNYGGSTTCYGIYLRYNNLAKISNNSISNTGTTSTLRGIYLAGSTNSSVDVTYNTITLNSGATTNQLTGIENAITGTGNTININNNIIQNCEYATATTGAFYGIYSSTTPTTVNINNNSITNNSIPGTGAMTLIDGGNCTTLNINNNIISGNSKTGASGTMYCIRSATAVVTLNGNQIFNNSISANSGTSASNIYGIYNFGSPTQENYFGNSIYNLSIAGASTSTTSVIYGIYTNTIAASNITVLGNIVYGFAYNNSSSGSVTINGIRFVTGTLINVFNNNIYNLVANGALSVVDGIRTSGGTNWNIYNNYISDLKTPAATGTNAVNGININSGTTVNAYYNTIYLTGTSSGTGFGSSGIYATSTPTTVDFRNNIVVNTCVPTGSGFTVVYRRNNTTFTNYSNNSNNNCWYAGTPSALSLIFYDGTNMDQTLAAFKTRMATRDQVSISEFPNWVSTLGSDLTYLHINTTIATGIESGGTNIASFTSDFDGDARNVTTPDIGADEFTGVPLSVCSGTPASSTINGAVSVCSGTGTSLTLGTAYTDLGITYQWQYATVSGGPYTNMGTSEIEVTGNLAVSTYYICTITCTNSGLFYITAEKAVTVNSLPTVSVTPTTAIFCTPGGTPVSLTANNAVTYSWSPAAGLSATTGDIVTANPATTTTYTVTGTDGNGCVNIATTDITVASEVILTATATPAIICSGDNSQLLASASQSYNNSANGYSFASSSGTYATLVGGTTSTAIGDDGTQTSIPIGFTFNFSGADFTTFGISTNGTIQLGTTATNWTNALATNDNVLAPMWDDNNLSAGTITYSTTGITPDRILTVDWNNVSIGGSGATAGSTNQYQIQLYETSNVIKFNYGSLNTTNLLSASIGISGIVGNFISVTPGTPATTSIVTENTTISSVVNLPTGTTYTFTPAPAPVLTYVWSPVTFIPAGQELTANPLATAITATTNYTVTVTGNSGCSATASAPVTVSFSITIDTQPISVTKCTGDTVTFTVVATGSSLTYQWRKNSVNINTVANPSAATASLLLPNVSLTDADIYDVVISAACGVPVTSNSVTLTVNPVPTASASSNSPVCEGSTINFTGTTDIGTIFSWTGPVTFSSTIQNPDISTAALSASGTYFFSATANGCNSSVSSIVVTINSLPDAVTITPATSTICAGSIQQLDASGGILSNVTILSENFNDLTNNWVSINNSTGGTPVDAEWTLTPDAYDYDGTPWHSNDSSQFYLSNSDAQGSGSTTSTILQSPAFNTVNYTSATVNFYHYFRFYTGSTVKIEASTDGAAWITLQTYNTSQGSFAAFASASVNLTAPFLNQPVIYIRFIYDAVWGYYWGIDNVSIKGNQSANITWSPVTDLYTDVIATTPYTGTVTSTVYAKPVIGNSIYTATSTTLANCTSSNTADVTVTSPLAGGTATPSATSVCTGTGTTITLAGNTGNIQWQSSPDGSTWSDIAGETSAALSTGNLTVQTYYQAVVSSNGCTNAISNAVLITIDPLSIGGTVTGGATVCSGSSSPLLTLGANTGSVVRWESSIDGGSNWNVIANTATTYTSGALTQTTQFRAVVKSGACSEVNSVETIVTVDSVSDGGTLSGGTALCSTTNSTVLTLTGYTGTILGWESSIDGGSIWTPISNTVNTYTANNINVNTDFRVIVQSGVCSSANSSVANFTMNTAPAVSILSSNDPSVCAGNDGSATVSLATSYSWSTIPAQTTQTASGLTAGTYFVTISDGVCPNSISVTLNDPGAPVVTLSSNDTTICTGTSVLFTAGGATDFLFSINGNPQGILSSVNTFSSSSLLNGDVITVIGETAGCTGNSTDITMIVSPVSVGGTLGGAATVCAGSNSTTLTLNSYTGNIVRWESSPDGTTWTPVAQTTNTYTADNLTSTTYFRVVVQSGVCNEINSSEAIINVNPISTGGTVTGGSTVCSGTGSTLTLTGNNGTLQWQSSADGLFWVDISGQTSDTLVTGNLTAITYFQVVVTSGVCSSAISVSDTVFVSPISVGGTVNSDTSVCYGTNSILLILSGNIGNVVNWQSSPDGIVWSDIINTTGSYSVTDLTVTTYFRAVVQSSVCVSDYSIPAIVTVVPLPDGVSATVSQNIICNGATIDLTATPSTIVTLLNENFNGITNTWTTTNTSTGGTPALADWTLQADSYVYSTTTFHSNDSSQFYLSNSDDQGSGGITATTLESPSFSTMGLNTLSLSFNHYYRFYAGSSATVEVWDGIVWTSIATFTSTVGTASTFVEETIDLSSYLELSSVKIRFKYDASWGYYWAIDNVIVTGVNPITYAWTSVPAGFTSSLQNPAGLTPTVSTLYNVVVSSSNGCSSMASVNVNVNPLPTGSLVVSGSSSICTGDSTQLTLSFTGTSPWTVTADDGLEQQTFNIPIPSVTTWVSPVDTTIYTLISVTDGNNCTSLINQSDTVIVIAAPVVNLTAPDTLCYNTGQSVSLDAGNVGATYVWNDSSTLQTLFVEAAIVGIGTHVYYVTVTNNNCSNVDSISIVVDICSGLTMLETEASISIYPNPTKGDFNIIATGLGKESVITLVNLIGQVIFEEKTDASDFNKNIDLSIYPKGIYFIKITNNKATKVERIIFQ